MQVNRCASKNTISFKKPNYKYFIVSQKEFLERKVRTILSIVPKIITIRDKNILFRDKNIFFRDKHLF
jgi:hypothetical protein